MQEFSCPLCGSNKLEKRTDFYFCAHCGGKLRDEFAEEQKAIIRTLFGAEIAKAKEEQIANVRSNLWEATHEKYTDSDKILTYARDLKNLLPDDFQANFYEVANGGNARDISRFLDEIDVTESESYLPDAIEFLIKSLEPNLVSAIKDLITRAYRGKEYIYYMTRVEDEALKLDEGVYTSSLPRDVFLAYSSADMGRVNEVCELLEGEGFTCFVALRNLRHGRGAVQNYQKELETAIKSCKCVVFLSSENSRSLSCDALKIEIPFMKDNCPQMGRIEYVIEDYGKKTTVAAKTILKSFFEGLEWCRTEEDLITRVVEAVTKTRAKKEADDRDRILREQQEKIARLEEMLKSTAGTTAPAASANPSDEELLKRMERARQERERKAEEEAERKAREEEAHKAKEEAKRKEQARLEAERLAQKEAACKANEYPTLENYDKNEFKIVGTVLKKYLGKGGSVKIPQGVTSIDSSEYNSLVVSEAAFYHCYDLTDVEIPDSVTHIGSHVFDGCSNLTKIVIPNSITHIGDHAFSGCNKLSSVVIPNGVTRIDGYAFSGCSLTEITVPDSLTDIKPGAFASLKLISLNVTAGNPKYHSRGNCIIETHSKTLVAGCNKSVIPTDGSVTKIGNYAFSGCRLDGIAIPDSVTSIGESAFSSCRLGDITIPDSVTSIGKFAFSSSDIWYIRLPSGITSIEDYTFHWCTSLQKIVTLPDGIISIGACAFNACGLLKSIVIPKGVKKIGYNAFMDCKSLTISCRSKKRPKEWDKDWNRVGRFGKAKVIWGYKGD